MPRVLLAIYDVNVIRSAKTDQCPDGNFGSICLETEHGFSEYSFTDGYKVQTANQLVIDPSFNAVSVPQTVKLEVSLHHSGEYPGS